MFVKNLQNILWKIRLWTVKWEINAKTENRLVDVFDSNKEILSGGMEEAMKTTVLGVLTHDVELNQMAHFWRRVYLALVYTGVPRLYIFDLQRPRARRLHKEYPEPVVGDEQKPVDGQYVRVPPSDPRNLWRTTERVTHWSGVCVGVV